jgi:hypothetical protein
MAEPMEAATASGPHGAMCLGTNRKGGPCGNTAGYKTDHVGYANCHFHGGSSPGGTQQAQRLAAEATVQQWGLPVATTATDALSGELARTFGRVLFLAARVQTLGEADLETSPWPGMERWERRHLADVAARMVGLDIDGRKANLMELLGTRLADGLDRALSGAGVPVGQRARVLELLPGALDSK